MKLQYIASFILICACFAFAQDYSGTVYGSNLSPVEGVLVSAGHSKYYTRTDANGRFSLSIVPTSINSGFSRPQLSKGNAVSARWNFRRRTLDLSGAHGITSAAIYSLNGKRLVNSEVGKSKIITLPSLSAGVYLLELRGAHGERTSGRVVLSNKNSSFTFRSKVSGLGGGKTRLASESAEGEHLLIFRHDNHLPFDMAVSGSMNNIIVRLSNDPRHVVFNQAEVHEYRFTMSQADWNHLETNGYDEVYKPANLVYASSSNGSTALSNVGLRYKGSNYSLPLCFNSSGRICDKVSFKVKFNTEFDESQRFYGMKRINLHAMRGDETKMRDMIAYELYREMGIHAPRTSYANVYVNDTYMGLFVAVEEIDGRFTKSRWPVHGDGNLYKEVWPTTSDAGHYLNALKTNDDPQDNPNADKMVAFYNAVNSSTEQNFADNLSEYMDFDHFLRYMAVDVAINNWDGIRGWYSGASGQWAGNHNFFFYEEENAGGKFWLVPWDLDNTFWRSCPYFEDAGVPNWNVTPPHCGGYMIWGDPNQHVRAPNCDKLTKMMASVFWERYKVFGKQFLDDQFQSSRVIAKINKHQQLIAPHIAADNTVNANSWADAVNDMKDFMPIHAAKFLNYLNTSGSGDNPGNDLVPSPHIARLSPAHLNDFELMPANSSLNWVQSYVSENSEVLVTINQSSALGGSMDLRYGFTFRPTDAPQGWDVWSNIQIEFISDSVDLSNVKEIRFHARSDGARTVNIALNNYELYKENNIGGGQEYGWHGVSIGSETREVVLNMLNLGYPSWTSGLPNVKQELLKSVKRIIFSVNGQYSDFDGLILIHPDTGFLQLDNIKFINN